jgi:hypothetical protein
MLDLTNILDPETEYKPSQLAKKLRLSNAAIFYWIKKGLPATKMPRAYAAGYCYFVRGADVISYLAKFNE